MNPREDMCPISCEPATVSSWVERFGEMRLIDVYECPRCGRFAMPTLDARRLTDVANVDRRKATACLRERTLHGSDIPLVVLGEISDKTDFPRTPVIEWDELVRRYPKTPQEVLQRALLNLTKMSRHFGASIASRDFGAYFEPVVFADGYKSMQNILKELAREGLIDLDPKGPDPITVTAKGWTQASEVERGSVAMPRNTQIFLSHATSDKPIALRLKEELEKRLPGISVFLSTDPTDLPPGMKWSREIQEVLAVSTVVLVLASARGLARPWVWFETGCVWFLPKRRIIPLCLGSIRKNQLPTPLSELMALNLDEEGDCQILLQELGNVGQVQVKDTAVARLTGELKQLDLDLVKQQLDASSWVGVEWDGKFIAYRGPIEGLAQIEDEIYRDDMRIALEAGGYKIRMAIPSKMSSHSEEGYRIVYLTDRRTWRRRIGRPGEVLMAKPQER